MPFLPGPHAPGAPPIWDILQNLPRKFLFFSFYISYFTIFIPCIIRRSLPPIHSGHLNKTCFGNVLLFILLFYHVLDLDIWTFFYSGSFKHLFFWGEKYKSMLLKLTIQFFPLSRGHVWSGPALSTPTAPCSRAAASWRGLYLNLCFILALFFYKMYLSMASPRSYY